MRVAAGSVSLMAAVLLSGAVGFSGESRREPKRVVEVFIQQINRNAHAAAYASFSRGLREEVTLGEFKKGIRQVTRLRIARSRVVEDRPALIRIRLELLARVREEGKWLDRPYKGDVVLIPERGEWKIVQVVLEEAPPGKKPVRGPRFPNR